MANNRVIKIELVPSSDIVRSADGSVAIEFAFVAPILVVLTLGVVEATNMLAQDRKVALANQTMVDMVARLEKVTNDDKTEIAQAVELVMEPYTASYSAKIAIVEFDDDAKPKFGVGSTTTQFAVKGSSTFSQGEMEDEAEGLGIGGDQVIIGRVVSDYHPILFPTFMGSSLILASTNTQRPRPQQIESAVSPPPPPPPPPAPPPPPPPPPPAKSPPPPPPAKSPPPPPPPPPPAKSPPPPPPPWWSPPPPPPPPAKSPPPPPPAKSPPPPPPPPPPPWWCVFPGLPGCS